MCSCQFKYNRGDMFNLACRIDHSPCSMHPDCYYKQLKRLEHKQEEIDKFLSQLGIKNDSELKSIQEYIKGYKDGHEQVVKNLKEQLEAQQPTGICDICQPKQAEELSNLREYARNLETQLERLQTSTSEYINTHKEKERTLEEITSKLLEELRK